MLSYQNMNTFFIIFTILWAAFLFRLYRAMRSIQSLDRYTGTDPESFSKVSIIIAVKDGEKEIEDTIEKLLTCHYPNFEVIVVNDRSTDSTEEIIQSLELANPLLRSVQINHLPEGWLGKVHALHQGIKHADGEYVLFMDADVVVSEHVLKASVKACQDNNLDHLGVLPEIIPGDFLLNVMTTTSILLFVHSSKSWIDISKRPIESTKGVGAYNFIKRSAFLKTEGFAWLKMDVADDVALAQLIAKNGGRSQLMRAGTSGLEIKWYESFRKFILGLEKNIVGGFTNYRPELIFMMSFISIMVSVIPIIALSTHEPAIFYSGICFFILLFIFDLFIKKLMRQSFFSILLLPLGISLFGIILLRAAYLCFRRGGIKWSGTFYSLKDLKEGTRVKLGL